MERFFNDYNIGIVEVDKEKKTIVVKELNDESVERIMEIVNGDKEWEVRIDPIYDKKQLLKGLQETAGKTLEKYDHSFIGRVLNWLGL